MSQNNNGSISSHDKEHLEMERKRDKEKKRRSEISRSVNRLTQTIDYVIPDVLNKSLAGAGYASSTPAKPLNTNRLNRTDAINTACDVIDLLNEEVLLLRAEKARRDSQDVKPSAGDGASTQQVIASTWTRPNESRPNFEVADRDLFNASQYEVSSGSNNTSADATMALLFLQHQQQLQCQLGPGGLAVRPTPPPSSSFEARLLQQQAADDSHMQQIRTRNGLPLQPHEQELLQQLRQQQEQDVPQQLQHQQQQLQEDLIQRQEESSRMHRVTYRPGGYEGQGRMPLEQPGIPAFAADRVGNAGTTPAMASFGGISASGIPPSQYHFYERYLQQQGQHGQNPH